MNEKFQMVPINDIEKMAVAVAKSQLFGMKTPEAAMALMLIAQSEGLHPARAAMEYHIINGKPSLKADAMLARFQNAGGKIEWHTYSDNECCATLSHPQGGSVKIDWTMKRATDAGLTSNPTWKKFPRAMLRARVISEGIRTVFPGVSVGMYTPEEVVEFEPAKNMGDAEVVIDQMPDKPYDFDKALDELSDAVSLAQLKSIYTPAAKAAKSSGDHVMLEQLTKIKDMRKDQLENPTKDEVTL